MKVCLRRIFVLALISLAIAMIFLPFNNSRSGSTNQEVVLLHKIELLNPDKISAQFPGIEIKDITVPELNPDYHPELFSAFLNLGVDWINENCELPEWYRFQESVLKNNSPFCLVIFREGLISCTVGEKEVVLLTYLGKYNPKIPIISESDLSTFPMIKMAINEIEKGLNVDAEARKIPIEDWDKMTAQYMDLMDDSYFFNFNGNFYEPEFFSDTIYIEGEIPNLQAILKMIGILFFFMGILLSRKLYPLKNESQHLSYKKTILFDFISLVFIVPAAYMFVNLALSKALYVTAITNEEFLLLIGTFFFGVGTPMLALLSSRLNQPSV